jgi:23S rRNA (adenine2503-C2)-methyltransferase
MSTLPNIRHLSQDQLKQFFTDHGEKAFRAKQAWEWLWMKSARSFEEMSNLSKETRTMLTENFSLPVVSVDNFQVSKDRTIKMRFVCMMEILSKAF